MAGNTPRGRIIWYENFTHNGKKSKDFYTKLFGWTLQPMAAPPGAPPYTVLQQKGTGLGGIFEAPREMQGIPSHWVMYVGVPDVDAATKQAKGLGATILVEPTDVPGMGRFSQLKDPQGAVLALWMVDPKMPAGDDKPVRPEVGQFSWHELGTDNIDKVWPFYQKMFGWELRERHDMGEMGPYQLWSRPGTPWPLGGMFNRPKEMPVSAWILYVSVPDIEAAVAKFKQLGGTIVMGPLEVPGGDMVAQGMDPNGAFIALHQVKH